MAGMVLLVAIILSLFFEWPANLVIVCLGVVGEVGEIVWGRRLARKWRPKTGAEAMTGKTAEVVSRLHPDGQVRLDGELWEARCVAGAEVGETVVVRRLEGLILVVDPVRSSQPDDVNGAAVGFPRGDQPRREAHDHE